MENKDLSVMSVLVFGEHHRHQEVTLLKLNSCASKCRLYRLYYANLGCN
jgi:hypothetical protein